MTIHDFTDFASSVFEIAGVAVLLAGGVFGGVRAIRAFIAHRPGKAIYSQARGDFGRAILLGLELLVAADIVRTVAVQPTFTNVAVLGMIILVRTFLSFSLEIELEGRLPWRAAQDARSAAAGDPLDG